MSVAEKIQVRFGDETRTVQGTADGQRLAFIEVTIDPGSGDVIVSWGQDEPGLVPVTYGRSVVIRNYARSKTGQATLKLKTIKRFFGSEKAQALIAALLAGRKPEEAKARLEADIAQLKWWQTFDYWKTEKGKLDILDSEFLADLSELEDEECQATRRAKELEEELGDWGLDDEIEDDRPAPTPLMDALTDEVREKVLTWLAQEFKRPMYRRRGPEKRLEKQLWPKILKMVSDIIGMQLEESDVRQSIDVMGFLNESPELLEEACRGQQVTLNPGTLHDVIRDAVAARAVTLLDAKEIALEAHRNAKAEGY